MSQEITTDSDNKSRLIRWLRPHVFPFDSRKERTCFIAVKHVSVSGKSQDVRTLSVPIIEANDDTRAVQGPFVLFAEEIHNSIVDDVEGTGGTQRYVLIALDEGGKALGRLPLRYRSTRDESDLGGSELDSEPNNKDGLLAQLMRHNEATNRISSATFVQLFGMMSRHAEQLAERCEALTTRHVEMLDTIEEVTSAKHEREIEMEGARSSSETKNRLARQAEVLIPALAKRFAGVDISPSNNPEVIEQRAFIDSLTEEQIMKMEGVLEQDQIMRLLSMVQSRGEREETGLAPTNGAASVETKGD